MGWISPTATTRALASQHPSRGGPFRRVWSQAFLGAVAVLFALANPGGAVHATTETPITLVSSEPATGAVMSVPPSQIVLQFDQEIPLAVEDAGTLTCGGNLIVTEDGEWETNRTKLTYAITGTVGRGVCVFKYQLIDGAGADIGSNTLTFNVETGVGSTAPPTGDSTTTTLAAGGAVSTVAGGNTATPSTPAPAQATSDSGFDPLLWAGRLVSTTAILILFGALVVINSGWPEGPEYYVTSRFLRTVWLIGLVGTVVYVIAAAAQAEGGSLGAGFNPVAWFGLLQDGAAGAGTVVRLIAVAASGYVALAPERLNDPNSAMWAWIIPALAVVTVALSRVSGPLLAVGLVVGIVHAFGSAVWFGGAVFVGRVVLAGPGEEDLVVATQAYSRTSLLAILVTVVSGVIQFIRLDGSDLFSSHGIVVMFKIAIVAVMLFIGLEARKQVRFRLDREYEMSNNNAARFRRAYGTETMFGVFALALSSFLVSLAPATELPWANEKYGPPLTFIDPQTGIEATVQIGPLTVGPNGYLIQVTKPESGISQLKLRFIPPAGTQNGQAWIVEDNIPLAGQGSVWRPTAVGIPLSVPGTWTLQLQATTQQGTQPGMSQTFVVTAADGSVPAPPPAVATTTAVAKVTVPNDATVAASVASSVP